MKETTIKGRGHFPIQLTYSRFSRYALRRTSIQEIGEVKKKRKREKKTIPTVLLPSESLLLRFHSIESEHKNIM